jgi:putative transposase
LINFPIIWPQFFTATIQQWHHILKDDEYKQIIVDSFRFLVQEGRLQIHAFVIMSNHIHVIWQPLQHYSLTAIQSSFMRQTAKQILKLLQQKDLQTFEKLQVNKYDRLYQFWKRKPLSVELFTDEVFMQKLDYIHQNPVKANIVSTAEDYRYSSAPFYKYGVDEFNIVTHYAG